MRYSAVKHINLTVRCIWMKFILIKDKCWIFGIERKFQQDKRMRLVDYAPYHFFCLLSLSLVLSFSHVLSFFFYSFLFSLSFFSVEFSLFQFPLLSIAIVAVITIFLRSPSGLSTNDLSIEPCAGIARRRMAPRMVAFCSYRCIFHITHNSPQVT